MSKRKSSFDQPKSKKRMTTLPLSTNPCKIDQPKSKKRLTTLPLSINTCKIGPKLRSATLDYALTNHKDPDINLATWLASLIYIVKYYTTKNIPFLCIDMILSMIPIEYLNILNSPNSDRLKQFIPKYRNIHEYKNLMNYQYSARIIHNPHVLLYPRGTYYILAYFNINFNYMLTDIEFDFKKSISGWQFNIPFTNIIYKKRFVVYDETKKELISFVNSLDCEKFTILNVSRTLGEHFEVPEIGKLFPSFWDFITEVVVFKCLMFFEWINHLNSCTKLTINQTDNDIDEICDYIGFYFNFIDINLSSDNYKNYFKSPCAKANIQKLNDVIFDNYLHYLYLLSSCADLPKRVYLKLSSLVFKNINPDMFIAQSITASQKRIKWQKEMMNFLPSICNIFDNIYADHCIGQQLTKAYDLLFSKIK